MSALEQALDMLATELAERVAAKVVERLRGGADSEWVDQTTSPLGARRHCAIARRRLQRGESGASKLGRRWLLTREALAAELEHGNASPPSQQPPASSGVRAGLERKLALLR